MIERCNQNDIRNDIRNDETDIQIHQFNIESTFNPRNNDAGLELYLSSLDEKKTGGSKRQIW